MRGTGASEGSAALRTALAPPGAATRPAPPSGEHLEVLAGATPGEQASAADPTGLACGMLMERHRLGPAQARTLLDQVACTRGVPSTQLAQALVDLLSPPPAAAHAVTAPVDEATLAWPTFPGAEAWRMLEELPRLHSSAVDRALGAVTSASEGGDAAAQLIADLTGAQPDRAVIYAIGDEGALHLLGNMGTAADVAMAWQQVPLVLDIPLCATVRQDRELFIGTPAEMEQAFPATKGSRAGTVGWASVPIRDGRVVVGVVGLSWDRPMAFDEAICQRISSAVERTGLALVRSLQDSDPAAGLLADLMHLIPDPWLVLGTAAGEADGYVVEAVAPTLPGGSAWVGRPLLAVFPALAQSGDLLTDLRQVMASGAPMIRTVSLPRRNGAPWEEQASELRLVRSGLRVVLTWRLLAAGA
jgi:hypothetical protein